MKCTECDKTLTIGDWPFCPHGKTLKRKPFQPYFDHQLGREITSLADRWRAHRELGVTEGGFSVGADLSRKSLQDAADLVKRGDFDFRTPEQTEQDRFQGEIHHLIDEVARNCV